MRAEQRTAERYVVVGLFDRLDVGAFFSRRDWPAHVTLASNFVIRASVDDLRRAVQRTDIPSEPVVVELGGTALFGPNRDVPVRLVLPGRVTNLHHALADQLEPLEGFNADEPAYWREGFRAHVTLTPTVAAQEGESRIVSSIAIARLEGDGAKVVGTVDIPDTRSADPVTVRLASKADAPGLASLKVEWARLEIQPSHALVEEFAAALRSWMSRHGDALVTAIAIAGGEVVGMAWMVLFERVPDVDDRRRLTADIQSVYVTPSCRGQGVGGRLVDLLCLEADSRGIPRVLVTASPESATLYADAGFEASPLLLQRRRPE